MKILCGVVLLVAALVATSQGSPLGSLRIVNGTEISIKEVPFQVYVNPPGCGGSILTRRHIVTAAHCRGVKFIRAGSANKESGGQKVLVDQIIVHPKYDDEKLFYDFALLVLAEDLVFNENVKAIDLARDPAPDGTMFLTSGWGVTYDSSLDKNLLRAVHVPQVNHDLCQTWYDEVSELGIIIHKSMVCVGFEEGGKSACFGDSGGPLVYNEKLYGVVSFGYSNPCGAPKRPGVYGNIPEVYDWYMGLIKDSM